MSKKLQMQGILNPEKWADIGVGPNCEGCGYPRETRDNWKFFISSIANRMLFRVVIIENLHKITRVENED
jgi:hypothetical protein